jgi:hypothetical protein
MQANLALLSNYLRTLQFFDINKIYTEYLRGSYPITIPILVKLSNIPYLSDIKTGYSFHEHHQKDCQRKQNLPMNGARLCRVRNGGSLQDSIQN